MKVTIFYIGSSLLGPLRQAEAELNRTHALGLQISAHNFGSTLNDDEWKKVESDLSDSDVVFVIHVMDGENAARLIPLLDKHNDRHSAAIVINCMPDLMRRTRMGRVDFGQTFGNKGRAGREAGEGENGAQQSRARKIMLGAATWVGDQTRERNQRRKGRSRSHTPYLKLVERLPTLLKFVPGAGKLSDLKNYLYLFCYFLQPTPNNVRWMILFALKSYVADLRLMAIDVPAPESVPAVAIYHPDAPDLFVTFAAYRKWYEQRGAGRGKLEPDRTIGLLLMRPQVVSRTSKHYDGLIKAFEEEGLAVVPALATLMDNREACEKFFVEDKRSRKGTEQSKSNGDDSRLNSRVSQIISLTGFSFVGGPAMNDSEAASRFLRRMNVPFRSAVSLDMQTVEDWRASGTGLNPVQAGMQIAIPEIDGATEPFVYGGIRADESEPSALEERCIRFAKRVKRWRHLQVAPRSDIKLALMTFCFPPNKGNLGTAADLDVFPSVLEILRRLRADGYAVRVPADVDELREMVIGGNSDRFGTAANVAYRMPVAEYLRACPYVEDIEREWGPAPGKINSHGGELLILGIDLGNVFLGVQPTFGYEGDPMRMLMSRSAAPHHGFMALYAYIEKILCADAIVHVGTHGSLEFMPGKQVGLSESCWPDRLIGELPNVYIYSVNNPSEGSIAKRRSYAELISYLTPPIENAGLYKDLASLKEMLMAYRQTTEERERELLFEAIESKAEALNLGAS